MSESELLSFYRGVAPDCEGRRLVDILAWDDDRLERIHDYIQWLFPLPEASRFNLNAPLLTPEDIKAFRSDSFLLNQVRGVLERLLTFLGLRLSKAGVSRGDQFSVLSRRWLQPLSHNHLRMTRIILFLRHIGLDQEASDFYACLLDISSHEGQFIIPLKTLSFWREAVTRAM